MSKPENIHGTGLVLGQAGLLLRGASGAGKSILALALLDRWEGRARSAFLVSDDRIDMIASRQSLTMMAPASIAGLVELRGRGIVRRPHRNSARLHLVVDLVDDLVRMPEEDSLTTELCGVTIARAPVPRAGVVGLEHQVLLVVEAISALGATVVQP